MEDGSRKRNFPYYSATQSFSLKRRTVDGAENAGRERSYDQPKIFEELRYDNYGEPRKHTGTDFSKWTPEQLKAFLDQRGGDYDDCSTVDMLIDRAIEVEVNTGPAQPPQPTQQEDDEYDPLEAFMSDINTEVKAKEAEAVAAAKSGAAKPDKPDLACDDEYDAFEYAAVRKSAQAGAAAAAAASAAGADSDEEVYAAARAAEGAEEGDMQFDDNDNPILDGKKRQVDVLPPLDHSLIEYDSFAKDFYEEGPELFAMDDQEVAAYRRQLEMHVSGLDPPKPVKEFNQCGFDAQVMAAIKKAGYEKPTAIQAQALPAALSGRDVLGIAKTGSGKTAAFVLPMLVHIMDQPELAKGEGPIGVIVAPTRELAEQIHKETRKFSRVYNLRVAAAIGGLSKFEQFKDLKAGSEVAVATPGRLIDLIKQKACTMQRATFLVLDEADRMFDLGFELQVRSIIGQIRPDRQTLLFSATMPRKIQRLVSDALANPVTITVGTTGVANADVRQQVEVLPDEAGKLKWLMSRLSEFIDQGEVIVFVGQRARVESLVADLGKAGARAGGIHGDLDQHSRTQVLDNFRQGKLHVLVATDVAARGLDIKTLKTVVNYDAAKDIDTHIHRVGRTGRAGDKEGLAITLLLPNEVKFAGQLVQSLALAGQPIPLQLHDLALKDPRFRKGDSRSKGGKGGRRKPQVGGAGLGYGSAAEPSQPAPFDELPGFARSHERYEEESSAAAAVHAAISAAKAAAAAAGIRADNTTSSVQQNNLPLPPPPPLPVGGIEAAKVMAGNMSNISASATAIPSYTPTPAYTPAMATNQQESIAPSSTGFIPPPQQQQQQQQTVEDARSELQAGRDNAREYVRNFHESKFRSNFVSSGTAGGTTGSGATIVAPKKQSANAGRPVPPPPIPVTERPMYLSAPAAAGGFGGARSRGFSSAPSAVQSSYGGHRDGHSTSSYHSAPPPNLYGSHAGQGHSQPSAVEQAAAAAKAIAAAQAIAARLAAQRPPGAQ